jgi:hypothetical protein
MMEVKVTVNEDGTTEVEVNGVQGSGCTEFTDAIVKALGGDVLSDKKKPEYYQDDKGKVTSGA